MSPPADAIIPANRGDGEARVREAFARLARSPRPLLLFVTHARGGGVARHVRELAMLLAPAADVLLLRAHRRSFLALEILAGDHAKLWFHRDDEWSGLCAFLRELGVARVHFHHVQAMPQRILDIGRDVGCPWDVTLHDYYPVCPQYQLTDASGRYCGEPDEAGCTRCLAANPAQWDVGIAAWRAAFGRLLADAGRVIAPSHDAAARIARYFPAVAPLVWPHPEIEPPAIPAAKVLVLGGLSPAKGMQLVVDCARDARGRGLALQFRVIGHVAWPVDGEEDLPLSFTGEFPEGALPSRIEQERGDAVLFPAQWPETYSYTLTAAIASGLPIVATDLGAFQERLAGVERARILPWNESPSRFNDLLGEVARGSPAPQRPGVSPTAREYAQSYLARYLEGIAARPAPAAAPACAPPGVAVEPDEWIPEATLAELFDDGVRCGNARSAALLRERSARGDRELAESAALRGRLASAESALGEARTKEIALDRDLVACREENARLAASAAAVEASTSWRMTAPLRALARLLRR